MKGLRAVCTREDVLSISEENWLQYFQTLHSNKNIYNELKTNERHGQHSRPLDFSIIKNKIRKLKNNKSPFSDKLEVKW